MKIQDIITENYLTELAPGGADSGGPYAYGMALKELAKLYAEEDPDRPATSSAEQDSSDAYEIDECADAFLTKGMEAGREAYMMIDDAVQEEMSSLNLMKEAILLNQYSSVLKVFLYPLPH